MKYSFLMPFINRVTQLYWTLERMKTLWGDRRDFEVVVVIDSKETEENRQKVIGFIQYFSPYVRLKIVVDGSVDCYNPSPLFNQGAKVASGEFLIVTNPECSPETDVLAGLDEEFEKDPNAYVICACRSLYPNGGFERWYEHSIYRPKGFHFCTALKASHYRGMGGFDEGYSKGWAYDDNDFRETVKAYGLTFVRRDDLIVAHQAHARSHPPSGYGAMLERNRKLYSTKWGIPMEEVLRQERE